MQNNGSGLGQELAGRLRTGTPWYGREGWACRCLCFCLRSRVRCLAVVPELLYCSTSPQHLLVDTVDQMPRWKFHDLSARHAGIRAHWEQQECRVEVARHRPSAIRASSLSSEAVNAARPKDSWATSETALVSWDPSPTSGSSRPKALGSTMYDSRWEPRWGRCIQKGRFNCSEHAQRPRSLKLRRLVPRAGQHAGTRPICDHELARVYKLAGFHITAGRTQPSKKSQTTTDPSHWLISLRGGPVPGAQDPSRIASNRCKIVPWDQSFCGNCVERRESRSSVAPWSRKVSRQVDRAGDCVYCVLRSVTRHGIADLQVFENEFLSWSGQCTSRAFAQVHSGNAAPAVDRTRGTAH